MSERASKILSFFYELLFGKRRKEFISSIIYLVLVVVTYLLQLGWLGAFILGFTVNLIILYLLLRFYAVPPERRTFLSVALSTLICTILQIVVTLPVFLVLVKIAEALVAPRTSEITGGVPVAQPVCIPVMPILIVSAFIAAIPAWVIIKIRHTESWGKAICSWLIQVLITLFVIFFMFRS